MCRQLVLSWYLCVAFRPSPQRTLGYQPNQQPPTPLQSSKENYIVQSEGRCIVPVYIVLCEVQEEVGYAWAVRLAGTRALCRISGQGCTTGTVILWRDPSAGCRVQGAWWWWIGQAQHSIHFPIFFISTAQLLFLPPEGAPSSSSPPAALCPSVPPCLYPSVLSAPSSPPTLPLKMASRPQNIGIKAIEIYFPSQVCCATCSAPLPAISSSTWQVTGAIGTGTGTSNV